MNHTHQRAQRFYFSLKTITPAWPHPNHFLLEILCFIIYFFFPPSLGVLRINYCKALCKWKTCIISKRWCFIASDVPAEYWQKLPSANARIDVLNSCCRTVPLGATCILSLRYVNWQLKIIISQCSLWCRVRNPQWTTWYVVFEFQLPTSTLFSPSSEYCIGTRVAIQNLVGWFLILENGCFIGYFQESEWNIPVCGLSDCRRLLTH